MHKNLRGFLAQLEKEKELVVIDAEVDPYLELAEIHRRVIKDQGPALLFTRVKGSTFPVVSNLFGTVKRVEMAVGSKPEEMIRWAVEALERLFPFRVSTLWEQRRQVKNWTGVGLKKVRTATAPVTEVVARSPDLNRLPVITSWPEDGGPFFTQPLVYTEHPVTGRHNLGMYRMQVFSENETGMHWQIHKGGGFHFYECEGAGQSLPVSVFLGGPPVLTLAAVAPLPEMVPELLFASLLLGEKLLLTEVPDHPHSLVAEADFALLGEVPAGERRPEGPFGDHYGYYSLEHDFPVFRIKTVYHRKDAVFPITVVGKPRQEDFFIGEYLQELLSPLFPLVMPGVEELWTYGDAGFHALAAARVRESYSKEAMGHAFRILGEGQLTLTKFLIVTNAGCSLKNFDVLLPEVLSRFKPEEDLLVIGDTSMDTLDYTGRAFNRGSKAVLLGIGEPVRHLSESYQQGAMPGTSKIKVFCPGCLLISGDSFATAPDLASRLISQCQRQLAEWPLAVLVDDADRISDSTGFLWEVFTRFDPAWDLFAEQKMVRNRLSYSGPVLIDARMKSYYPKEVVPDSATVYQVSRRWKEYFPQFLK